MLGIVPQARVRRQVQNPLDWAGLISACVQRVLATRNRRPYVKDWTRARSAQALGIDGLPV